MTDGHDLTWLYLIQLKLGWSKWVSQLSPEKNLYRDFPDKIGSDVLLLELTTWCNPSCIRPQFSLNMLLAWFESKEGAKRIKEIAKISPRNQSKKSFKNPVKLGPIVCQKMSQIRAETKPKQGKKYVSNSAKNQPPWYCSFTCGTVYPWVDRLGEEFHLN